MINIRLLNSTEDNFWTQLDQVLAWEQGDDSEVFNTVKAILADVKKRGDAALLEYTVKYDQLDVNSAGSLELGQDELRQAVESIDVAQRKSLEKAAARIRVYAEKQKMDSWSYKDDDGNVLGQKVTPIDRVGLYVPGGKAAYPSSVLMNAIPAKVAEVPELIMVVPTTRGEKNNLVLAAASIAGVDRVFTIGGAQAVAALAYGTETIPKVDKITGPGNAYVAMAKRLVYGVVGIDMIAGPSEILVVCDGKTDPDWIAMDLFSQAEHDELAQSILVSTDAAFLQSVKDSIDKLISDMPRKGIIETSLQNRAAMIQVASMEQAIEVANHIAPEHLELSVDNADRWAENIRHAGAIFMGRYTAEAIGDYCAGPNHVLPTSGTARFSSPLGVYDFQKRSSLIDCSEQGAQVLGKLAASLARGEGLEAHAQSAEYRVKNK